MTAGTEERYSYMVSTEGDKPDLIRSSVQDGFQRYDPRIPEKWKGSKFLDSFAWGGGDWIWYDDVSEEKAKEYMMEIDRFWVEHPDRECS